MRVLITGATGLVGEELTKLLLQNGIKINYLTTSKSKIENQPNFHGYFWNPKAGIIDENALIGVSAIIHLAGASVAKRWTKKYKQEIVESRVFSTNLLYNTLKNNPHQVRQIISASAVGVYPDSKTAMYKEEFNEFKDTFLSNVVMKWEESVNQLERLNIKVCKLRIGLVLSDKGGALPQMLGPIKKYVGTVFGSGKQFQSWIHIDDLTNIFLFALKNKLNGVYNAVAPNPVTNAQLVHTIAEIIEKPIILPPTPKFVLKMILGEMHTLLFESQQVSSLKLVKEGFDFRYKTIFSALDQLIQK
ncbi:MAG: TIGR01777 family oxidoreductase [Limnohabitans sp.]|nr:TIGR01777 family oxidoreductase [Limnohabitans sp.]